MLLNAENLLGGDAAFSKMSRFPSTAFATRNKVLCAALLAKQMKQ
jgi:hypothetical protein